MSIRLLPLIAVAALSAAAVAPAQTASYTFVGSSCTGGRLSPTVGPVPLSVRGLPRLGMSFEVVTECSTGYPWGVRRAVTLITGRSNQQLGGLTLPFDISTLFPGQPVCGLLRTSNEVSIPVPLLSHYTTPAVLRIDVPNNAALLGVNFFQQVVSVEASTFGPPFRAIALSRMGHGVIGR